MKHKTPVLPVGHIKMSNFDTFNACITFKNNLECQRLNKTGTQPLLKNSDGNIVIKYHDFIPWTKTAHNQFLPLTNVTYTENTLKIFEGHSDHLNELLVMHHLIQNLVFCEFRPFTSFYPFYHRLNLTNTGLPNLAKSRQGATTGAANDSNVYFIQASNLNQFLDIVNQTRIPRPEDTKVQHTLHNMINKHQLTFTELINNQTIMPITSTFSINKAVQHATYDKLNMEIINATKNNAFNEYFYDFHRRLYNGQYPAHMEQLLLTTFRPLLFLDGPVSIGDYYKSTLNLEPVIVAEIAKMSTITLTNLADIAYYNFLTNKLLPPLRIINKSLSKI